MEESPPGTRNQFVGHYQNISDGNLNLDPEPVISDTSYSFNLDPEPATSPQQHRFDLNLDPAAEDEQIPGIIPIFESFRCPLTKLVMKDPVTIENGQTFERAAIEEWFRESAYGRMLVCPITSRQLQSTALIPNVVHRLTIEEWILRNELARLKHFRDTITSESSQDDTVRALSYVEDLHRKGGSHGDLIRRAEALPMVTSSLRSTIQVVRRRALEVLCVLVEDDANKEALGYGDTLRTIVKFLYHNLPPEERDPAARLLYELSKSASLSGKIGGTDGAILVLVGMASNAGEKVHTKKMAEMTLQNLESCEKNVIKMAEVGRLQPLIRLFLEGSPATQYSAALCLGGLALDDAAKVAVAQAAGTSLALSLKSENIQTKEIALRALTAITSCESSANMLIEMGILPPLVEILFAGGSKQPVMRLRPFSATILANIISSGAEFESIVIDEGSSKTLISEDVIRNLLHLVSTTSSANQSMGCKLLQILECLTKSRRSVEQVADVIKICRATAILVDIVEVSAPDISSEAIKILRNISPFMGSQLSTALCSSNAINKLIEIVLRGGEVCEEQAVAVGLLANLPDNDLDLVQRLFDIEAFKSILARLIKIHQRMIIGERASTYFEGLVRVLSKLTYMLQCEVSLELARDNKLAAIFADLLRTSGIDNVRVASAMALRNLSQHTLNLARNQVPASSDCTCVMCCCFWKKPAQPKKCEVHGEVCSLTATFCLVEGGVVETLVACLHHHNESVVEAALEALCTLLEDGLNIQEGVLVIERLSGVEPVMNILISRRTGRIHQLAIWAIERLLRTQSIAQGVSSNLNVRNVLIDAFQHDDAETRNTAREALKRIELLPPLSMVFKT